MSDIHGNRVALDAVLEHIESDGGADEFWILGDLVDAGPTPVEVLNRLHELQGLRCIRGNTDRYVVAGGTDRFSEPGDPSEFNVEAAGSIGWVQGAISYGGWLDWLSKLPLTIDFELPDGTTVLGVHASPTSDTGLGFRVGLTESEIGVVLGDCTADLVLGGHHHRPLDICIGNQRVVNVGSVSIPFPPDLRANYVMIEAEASGYTLESRRVDYDRDAVIDHVKRLRHPGIGYINAHLKGERKPMGREFIESRLKSKTTPTDRRSKL